MEKIRVEPKKVRGLGNILPKIPPSDFSVRKCDLSEVTVTIEDEERIFYSMESSPILSMAIEKNTLEYSEKVSLSVHLEDRDGEPVTQSNVKFYNENDYNFTTRATDSNGDISFEIYSYLPGPHSYRAVLEGNTSVYDSVDIIVNAPTLTVTPSASSVDMGESITVTYLLEDSNGNPISNEQIIVHECYNSQSCEGVTKTVASDGKYNKTITLPSPGQYTVYCTDRNASTTSNIVQISWTLPYDGILLSEQDGKSILSKYDGDKALLTAQLRKGTSNVAVEDVAVTFKQGETELATEYTDNTGKAVYEYTSQAVKNNVIITATVEGVPSETYTLEDCDYYADSNKIGNWNNVTQGTYLYKLSSYRIGLASFSAEIKFNVVDAQVIIGNQTDWLTGISLYSATKQFYSHASTGTVVTDTLTGVVASDVWRIEVKGSTIRLYKNDGLVLTKSNCKVDYPKNLRAYPRNKYSSIEYIKIKPL